MNEQELKQQIKAALELIVMISECIRRSKRTLLGGIPSGHLYSLLMNAMSLEAYSLLIEKLKQAKLIEERNHLLIWIAEDRPPNLPHLDEALEAEMREQATLEARQAEREAGWDLVHRVTESVRLKNINQ